MTIDCILPDKNIYKFDGQVKGSDGDALQLQNFVPRGSVLKFSDEVYAMVLYTGVETKQVLNQGQYKHKISQLQREVNKYMAISFVVILVIMIFMSQVMNRVWHKNNIKGE